MFGRVLSWLAVLALVAFVSADEAIKTEEGVLVLTKDNFEDALSQNEFILVEFCEYTPFLFACTSLTIHNFMHSFHSRIDIAPSFVVHPFIRSSVHPFIHPHPHPHPRPRPVPDSLDVSHSLAITPAITRADSPLCTKLATKILAN